jgi:hypothetical protein
MAVQYEWIVEQLDEHGDIYDTSAFDTARAALQYMRRNRLEDGGAYHYGLCRDSPYPRSSRSWAYVENGELPACFTDACDSEECAVPKRFRAELAQALGR